MVLEPENRFVPRPSLSPSQVAPNNDNVVTYEEFLSSSCKVVADIMNKILGVLSNHNLTKLIHITYPMATKLMI